MNIGNRVMLDGQIGTIISEERPKCRCKGKGHWVIQLDNEEIKKSPIGTELILVESIEILKNS